MKTISYCISLNNPRSFSENLPMSQTLTFEAHYFIWTNNVTDSISTEDTCKNTPGIFGVIDHRKTILIFEEIYAMKCAKNWIIYYYLECYLLLLDRWEDYKHNSTFLLSPFVFCCGFKILNFMRFCLLKKLYKLWRIIIHDTCIVHYVLYLLR